VELGALEFHQARILFGMPVERHADFPRAAKNFGIPMVAS